MAINLLNPQAVVIGGDMAAAFDSTPPACARASTPGPPRWPPATCRSCPATHGDRAGLVGCAALALDHVLAPAAVDARLVTHAPPAPVDALR